MRYRRHGLLANIAEDDGATRSLSAFLHELFGPDAPIPVWPQRTVAALAVPESWTEGSTRTAPGDTSRGRALISLLGDEVGFASARLVPALQCAAAVHTQRRRPDAGNLLLCDIGSSTVDIAVCDVDGSTSRLLDAEQCDAGTSDLATTLLADPARIAALDDERCHNARRARLVLQRARVQDRYLDTPVYLPGTHGPTITAATVLDALRPVAELAARAVSTLLSRFTEPLLPEMVVTGGNAMGPVLSAILDAADGRVTSIDVLDPDAVAAGALLVATGQVTAIDHYPHQLGIAVHRIVRGELESTVIPVSESPETPTIVEVRSDHNGPIPVLIKPGREGQWRVPTAATPVLVPPGSYRIEVSDRHSGLGGISLRPIDGGPDIVCALGTDPGPVAVGPESSTDEQRSRS